MEPGVRGHVDHSSGTLLAKRGNAFTGQPERPARVHTQYQIPVFVGDPPQDVVPKDPRVVYEHVYPTGSGKRSGNGRSGCFRRGYVADNRDGAGTAGDVAERSCVEVNSDDVGPGGPEKGNQFRADPAGRPGDYYRAAGEVEGQRLHTSPLSCLRQTDPWARPSS